jgi:PhnB protein
MKMDRPDRLIEHDLTPGPTPGTTTKETTMSFHPYLFFSNGECRAAFEWYHGIFGGDLQIMTMADVPDGVESMPGAEPHHAMHAAVTIGESVLMGSDDPTGDGGAKVGVAVAFNSPDEQTAKRLHDALSEGGEVTIPFGATFWSKGFGACTDRYGVQWMVDTAQES